MVFEDVATLNRALRDQKAGITVIYNKGSSRLCLRATLPPKPKSTRLDPRQQTISTGLRDSEHGRLEVYRRALKMSIDLATGQFDWGDWITTRAVRQEKVGAIVARFAADYQRKAERDGRNRWRMTWEKDYLAPFHRLDGDRPLDPHAMNQIVEQYGRASRPRQRYARAYEALCKFAGVEDVTFDAGSYGRKHAKPLEVPSDAEIEAAYDRVPERWRWAYGVMACYGLRPSEVIEVTGFADDDEIELILGDGKTGGRRVRPLDRRWFDLWDLSRASYPIPDPKTSKGITAERLAVKMSRAISGGAGFPPKVLRKATAIRLMAAGIPDTIAGRLLGHDPQTLKEHYQSYVSDQGVREIMARYEKAPAG